MKLNEEYSSQQNAAPKCWKTWMSTYNSCADDILDGPNDIMDMGVETICHTPASPKHVIHDRRNNKWPKGKSRIDRNIAVSGAPKPLVGRNEHTVVSAQTELWILQ